MDALEAREQSRKKKRVVGLFNAGIVVGAGIQATGLAEGKLSKYAIGSAVAFMRLSLCRDFPMNGPMTRFIIWW